MLPLHKQTLVLFKISDREGTSSNESTLSIVRNSNDDNAPSIRIGKTRGTSVGSNTTVSNDDFIGLIRFFAADGTDRDNDVASIFCQIDVRQVVMTLQAN